VSLQSIYITVAYYKSKYSEDAGNDETDRSHNTDRFLQNIYERERTQKHSIYSETDDVAGKKASYANSQERMKLLVHELHLHTADMAEY
jgi:hypothetical protein